MQTDRPTLSVVAPVYNEEAIVDELIDRVLAACRQTDESFEFVIVNDGSRDHSLDRLVARSAQEPELRVVDLLRNFGHMHALSAGVAVARGEAVLVLDGDLQDPPELIPNFVTEWRKGYDVLYGLRTERRETAVKQFAIGVFYSALHLVAETPIPRQVGTFSLMDRRIVDIINTLPERDRYFAGLRAWIGGRQGHVPYERVDRTNGRSRVGTRGLLSLARTALISFSKAPLRGSSMLALLTALTVLLVGLGGATLAGFARQEPPVWSWVAIIGGLLGLVQGLAIAAIAEYTAVITDEVKGRPSFLIRQEYVRGQVVSPAAVLDAHSRGLKANGAPAARLAEQRPDPTPLPARRNN